VIQKQKQHTKAKRQYTRKVQVQNKHVMKISHLQNFHLFQGGEGIQYQD